jgi:tetratricopeptide (TPR) repeat protein
MGIYWSDKAHQARGSKWSKDTSDKQISTMNKHFISAWKYLQKGLQLNPSIIQAYGSQLSITRTSSHYGSPQQFMQQQVPVEMKHNLEIWDTLLQSSIPRWGGSYQLMEDIIKQQVPIYLSNLSDADLQALNDTISYDRIDTLMRNNKYKTALKLATKSIEKNTRYTAIYSVAGHLAFKLKKFKACYDYEGIATKLRPWSVFSWNKRGLCAIKLQLWPQANEAFRYAVFINGLNKYDLFKLGQTYMYLLQFDKAYAMFKKSEELDPEYKQYTEMYTSYIEKEKTAQMNLVGKDIYQIIGKI